MFYEGWIAAQVAKDEIRRAERRATEAWRFRDLKTRESKILAAVVTSILGLFVR